jgi:hypothetical protein
MESTRSGSYRDYPPANRTPKKQTLDASTGGSAKTGDPKASGNICANAIVEVSLEEVARCDYFKQNDDVPSVKTRVQVRDVLVDGRVGVETTTGSIVVGFLPTSFNYVRKCVADGFRYEGTVVSSARKPIPIVVVTLNPR